MKPLTKEEIAELRALDHETTPPPWTNILVDGDSYFCGVKAGTPATVPVANDVDPKHARLIAAARNALPRLLDEVERARALLKRIERKGGTYREREACPACDAVEGDDETITHRTGCEIAALLAGS